MTTIKEAILSTVEQNIDSQGAKGLKNYGMRLEDCDHDKFDWPTEINQELIDALNYQQMEIRKMKRLNAILETENKKLKQELKFR